MGLTADHEPLPTSLVDGTFEPFNFLTLLRFSSFIIHHSSFIIHYSSFIIHTFPPP
jgi:hypothetical protein